MDEKEQRFLSTLEEIGFIDEEQFLEVQLSKEERNDLSGQKKKLDSELNELQARLKVLREGLVTEQAKKITNQTVEELETQGEELKRLGDTLQEDIVSHKHKLKTNKDASIKMKENQDKIEAQQKEFYRWKTLHDLIGSADGKRYRLFAQGVTFELLISHANQQLVKMSDRYLLARDDEKDLALNVFDDYQAGEIRPVSNLSGGESFIISLSLALGLSNMASRDVRVDSLFLDEGFGTLDEESLEIALDTLSGLQQEGKMIGIISHVAALKERISTRINVTRLTSGHSSVTGPGVERK